MNWFYATNDQTQLGPVDDATIQELARSGTITPETFIWKAGMENWQPYSTVFASSPVAGAIQPPGSIRCAECGQAFHPEQLISLAGRFICGACKPVAVQKFQEGVVGFGSPVDAEALWKEVEARGFDFTIGSVLSRSWNLVKGNFWPSVGVALLGYLIMMGANQIPLLGIVAVFLVQQQMMAGLNWYFLKQFRGEPATLNDSFAGFRRGFGQQALYMLIIFAVMFGIILVGAIPLAIAIPALSSASQSETPWIAITVAIVVIIPLVIVLWYFTLCWIFTPLLILDKGLKATAAMKLSRRVIRLHIWKVFGLFLVVGLLCLVSLLALLIGIVVMLPVAFATISRLYEDAFGDEGSVKF